jgi:hypothetical protein
MIEGEFAKERAMALHKNCFTLFAALHPKASLADGLRAQKVQPF